MKYDDVYILSYIEDRLIQAEKIEFEKEMSQSPKLRTRVQLIKQSQMPVKEAFATMEIPPIPQRILDRFDQAVEEKTKLDQQSAPPRRVLNNRYTWALAACFALVFYSLGLLTNLDSNHESTDPFTLTVSEDSIELVESALYYQALYARETVENLNQSTEEANSVISEFNNISNTQFEIPDLTAFDLQFKRVQPLAYKDKKILQLVYIGKQGKPVALCVTQKDQNSVMAVNRYNKVNMTGRIWQDENLMYILIATEDYSQVNQLHDFVFQKVG